VGIWSRKTVGTLCAEADGEGPQRLKRSLGIVGLTAFGVGCTIGAGIFSLTGDVAAHQAGPAVTLAFVLASVACFFAGLCYAEFAAMVPIAGSAYSYAYATLGELVAWIIGWSLMLEWLFSASVVAISWSGYVTAALKDLGVVVPAAIAKLALHRGHARPSGETAGFVDLPAVLVTLGCTRCCFLARRHPQTSIRPSCWQRCWRSSPSSWPAQATCKRRTGIHSCPPIRPVWPLRLVRRRACSSDAFFAYIGFDGVSTLAEEAKNPQRTVPWSLFASLFICTVLYVGVSLVITGLTDYRGLDVPDPLYYALNASHMPLIWLKGVIAIVAILGLISVVLVSIVGQVRIFFAMARDGLVPRYSDASTSTAIPLMSERLSPALLPLSPGIRATWPFGELISIGTLLAFAVVCAGILILRRIAPKPGGRSARPGFRSCRCWAC